MRPDSSQIHLLLNVPPRSWAAFLFRKNLCRGAHGCAGAALVRTKLKIYFIAAVAVLLGACAAKPPKIPYPAFIQVDEMEDIFMASLPGVRAKQLSGDPQTRRTSNRIDLPADWNGTSGGVPGRSMEIFLISGEMMVADIELKAGGYAFLPAGSLGFNLLVKEGARILYFVNDTDPESIIRSPIIINSYLLNWDGTTQTGVETKELRNDPGNGAKTWLLRVATGAAQTWESSTAIREGYLVVGEQQYAECVNGEVELWQYTPGGYFYRPANTISGGPESLATTEAVWFLRETSKGNTIDWPSCTVSEKGSEPF
jgi:hypothetical protein